MKNTKIILFILSVLLAGAAYTQAGIGDDNLTAGEYFFDTDPGEGNGYALQAVDGTFDTPFEDIDMPINLPELTSGPHYLYIRLRNAEGIWGIPNRHLMVVTNINTITAAEYFYDTDPGEGSGQSLEVVDGDIKEDVELSDSLVEGLHKMYIRMKDEEGSWGPARQYSFEVVDWTGTSYIKGAEYFIDTDPGEGNGTQLSAVDHIFNDTEEAVMAKLRTSELAEGDHTLYFRAQNIEGNWTQPTPYRNLEITPFYGKIGDLNDDDKVDLTDAILALMVLIGQNPGELREDYQTSGVDVDDWRVGLPEAVYVLEKVAE
ncbi:MAG: hypothetical protein GY702_16390 [Desulfobulbaceae bacterium]|nr:hypothetical protein [Desulfobulbaceae bacterium]